MFSKYLRRCFYGVFEHFDLLSPDNRNIYNLMLHTALQSAVPQHHDGTTGTDAEPSHLPPGPGRVPHGPLLGGGRDL